MYQHYKGTTFLTIMISYKGSVRFNDHDMGPINGTIDVE
jgi:hypothetical protein